MQGTDKLLISALKAVLKVKHNKSDVEQGTLDAIQNSYDYSNRNQIEPLIHFIKTT